MSFQDGSDHIEHRQPTELYICRTAKVVLCLLWPKPYILLYDDRIAPSNYRGVWYCFIIDGFVSLDRKGSLSVDSRPIDPLPLRQMEWFGSTVLDSKAHFCNGIRHYNGTVLPFLNRCDFYLRFVAVGTRSILPTVSFLAAPTGLPSVFAVMQCKFQGRKGPSALYGD